MANGFLVPFATGALTELQRQKQVSDDIAASVVDSVSQHVLGVEIPAERKLIKAQEDLKKKYASTYDQKVADGMDAMGLFDSGTEEGLARAIKIRFADKYNIGDIVSKINAAKPEDYSKLIQTSFIGSRKSALEDRSSHVDNILKDTKNIKDLLIGETPTGLARFIGEPLGKGDEAAATARLTTALEGPSVQPAKPTDAASLLGLEVGGKGATEQIYNFENLRHRELANKASANFERMFKDPNLGTYKFNYDKKDTRYDTAQRIIKGFNEARDAGYELGIIDYAREQYIDIVLKSQGVVNYLSNYQTVKPSGAATALQPGTTEGTQTGTKVDETQTVASVEDVGAISAKRAEGETAKEAAEKTEKISVPKSTIKVNIGTGDAAPAPSELNQNAPGIQLANDGMLYSKGKAVKMFPALEKEIEEASAIAFQIKASDLSEEVKEKNLADLRRDFLQTIAGFGITQYTPEF
tara:strand:+ start:980 stop:2383 length:1404 start_codon:yes stop_codon:yes gene_type:complete